MEFSTNASMIATSAVASGTVSAPASSSSSSRLMVQGTKERFNKNGMFVDESLSSSISSSVSSGTYSSKGEIKKDYEVEDRIDDAPPLVDIEPKHQHHQYTWEELSKYFGISLKEAATMLKIHPTQLKRITEASGITKWPYQGVKKISEYRKLEQISEINSIEEMKFGNTVIEETIEFGLRNTAKRVPISVKLAEFKGAKYRRKFVMPPMTPMIEPGFDKSSAYNHDDISMMPCLFLDIVELNMSRQERIIQTDGEAEFHDILMNLWNSPIDANDLHDSD